jgi:hypothetical protein
MSLVLLIALLFVVAGMLIPADADGLSGSVHVGRLRGSSGLRAVRHDAGIVEYRGGAVAPPGGPTLSAGNSTMGAPISATARTTACPAAMLARSSNQPCKTPDEGS